MINLHIEEPVFSSDKEALDWYRKQREAIAWALDSCERGIKSIEQAYNL